MWSESQFINVVGLLFIIFNFTSRKKDLEKSLKSKCLT